jgi:hypothetical protein
MRIRLLITALGPQNQRFGFIGRQGGRRLDFGAVQLEKAPVDQERLAISSKHDVFWLKVAMQDLALMGVLQRVAHIEEPAKQFLEL